MSSGGEEVGRVASARLRPRAQKKHGEHKKELGLGCRTSAEAACSSLPLLALPGASEGALGLIQCWAVFALEESPVSPPGAEQGSGLWTAGKDLPEHLSPSWSSCRSTKHSSEDEGRGGYCPAWTGASPP